jgi:hypothetical protein
MDRGWNLKSNYYFHCTTIGTLCETGSHRTAHARMEVASACACCKPVAEGGASVGLRVLRGARKRTIIRYGDQEERRSSPVLPLMRGRGGRPFPLTHETRCLAGGGGGGVRWGPWCWRVSVGLGAGGGGGGGGSGPAGLQPSLKGGALGVGGPSWTRGAL